MARKLTPEQVRAFLEAAPLSELAFGAEDCPARHLRRALDHPSFEQPAPTLSNLEFLFCDETPKDNRK